MTAMMEATTQQKTMPLEEVLKLESGDFGGPMADVYSHMDGRPSHLGHRGKTCDEYILEMALDMQAHGWDGPPVCVAVNEPRGWAPAYGQWLPSLTNGHHRTMAAWLAGLADVPVTSDWDQSED